jgi:hypothetical protein
MGEQFRLDDEVLLRFVQIIQEAMLLGVDCADIMRQVRLERSGESTEYLVLTKEYKNLVSEHHTKLLQDIEKLSQEVS